PAPQTRAACCGCSPAPGPGGHARRSAPRCAFYPRNPRLPASVTPRPSGTEPYSISPCRPFRQGKAPGLQSPVDCCLTLLPRFRMPLVPADISRREFLELGAAAGLACATSAGCRTGVPAATTRGLAGPAIPPFALQEATIADLQAGMQSGKYTARGLCEYYLTRIDELDGRGPALHSIIGKANLSEWANFRSSNSSSGWSARGGQCKNPYALDRSPCGSSSGTAAAIAANFGAVGVGTETDGSIVCPAAACSLVGIKPTLGLV